MTLLSMGRKTLPTNQPISLNYANELRSGYATCIISMFYYMPLCNMNF